MSKPSLVAGTRDFSPADVARRRYIFDTITRIYAQFGYLPIETPTLEKMSTLTGKYGNEGEQLIYKVLNSGDFLSKIKPEQLTPDNSNQLSPLIAEKGLRYDLTVPFARYVVMNQNDLAFPFKRYQIQPVWRAERNQAGRYREFYQCDADAIGSDSLLYEAEILQMLDQVFNLLKLKVIIRLNNRKILDGLCQLAGAPDLFAQIVATIDKADKIGQEAVLIELKNMGLSEQGLTAIKEIVFDKKYNLSELKAIFETANVEIGKKGVDELNAVLAFLRGYNFSNSLELDFSLARGLSYYTGAIMEVVVDTSVDNQKSIKMGSISGGGRYDNLTAVFGLPNMSGVGISFGADRIFDVLLQLNLFPDSCLQTVKALLVNFDEATLQAAFELAGKLRAQNIAIDIYPKPAKLKKQLEYAQKRNLPFVVICEAKEGVINYQLKNMQTGTQESINLENLIAALS